MNEFNFNTEENFIQPSGRKQLEELFDVEIKPVKGDESLRYTSPRAANNEHKNEGEITRSPWQTLLAKMVVGFKNGETFGRVGMAILKNIDNAHRIIVYKSKANMLATLTITQDQLRNRVYLHRQNCYWQFYDDVGIYWSLLFDRAVDESQFVSKLQACGFRMHLDVEVNPESPPVVVVAPAPEEHNKRHEVEKTEKNKAEKMHSEPAGGKQVRIKEDRNDEHVIKEGGGCGCGGGGGGNSMRSNLSSNSGRANLLNRLSKIGAQQLPQLNEASSSPPLHFKNTTTTTTTEYTDTEPDSSGDRGSTLTIVGHQIYSQCAQPPSKIIFPPMSSQETPISSSKNLIMQPMDMHVMQMMLVENRTQNTELRINMDKLDNKLEKVLERIDKMHISESQEDDIIKLEEQILELKKENRRLKKEYKDVTERSDTSLENVWRIYEAELNSLGMSLSSNMYGMESLIGELLDKVTAQRNEYRDKELQLKSTLTTAKEINDRYHMEKKSHNETIEKMEHMMHKIKTLQATCDSKTKAEAVLHDRINKLKSKHATEITNVKVEMTQALKDIMNTLYHNLAKNIVDMERLVPEEILPLIGKTIRQDTLAAVAKISK